MSKKKLILETNRLVFLLIFFSFHVLGTSTIEHSRTKKEETRSNSISDFETKEFSLKLFRCNEDYDYILEMNEVATGKETFYALFPSEISGKMKMEAKEVYLGLKMVVPVTEEVYPDIESKYNLSLQERLEGWTVEIRERTGTTKTEKNLHGEPWIWLWRAGIEKDEKRSGSTLQFRIMGTSISNPKKTPRFLMGGKRESNLKNE
ncbi:hypothetical protein DH2020_015096 [Rehmannia glutinosa]|uniref:Uncharacterized protein n=1 Tax=Rehmannia glutinosa TaxID=99300 RepID=A0ABR0X0W9_REHGL